jgi:hypothetical protein
MTKGELAVFKEHIDRRFAEIDYRFKEFELRMVVKLGLINVTATSIAVAILGWLIKTK